MGFPGLRAYVDAMNQGRAFSCSLRKVPSQATVAGWWADLSMASGNPLPNYYASNPLVAATLDAFRGIFHGDARAPAESFLTELMLTTPTAGLVGRYILLDYLLYYPFIDGDDLDTQVFDNTVALPRYADGDGVQAMLVAVAPTVGGGSFTLEYVNQNGVTSSVTNVYSTASAGISSIASSQPAATAGLGPFLNLAPGDTGIRSVTSIVNLAPTGGLVSLVLVKPLADLAVREVNTPAEVSYVNQRPGPPRIYDGAYLGLIVNCAATIAAGLLAGRANFAWN